MVRATKRSVTARPSQSCAGSACGFWSSYDRPTPPHQTRNPTHNVAGPRWSLRYLQWLPRPRKPQGLLQSASGPLCAEREGIQIMSNETNDVRSPCKLLPCPYCGRAARYVAEDYVDNTGQPWPFAECDACNTGAPVEFWNKRAQPADQQGEPVAWVECSPAWLKSGGDCATAPRICVGRNGISHLHPAHAQPATAKVDERAAFDKWVMANSMQGVSMFDVWQARAKLNVHQS